MSAFVLRWGTERTKPGLGNLEGVGLLDREPIRSDVHFARNAIM